MAHSIHYGGKEIAQNRAYTGAEFVSTGMQLTEVSQISINGSIFAPFNKDEEIYIVNYFTYTFKEDTTIKNIFIDDPAYEQSYSNSSDLNVGLLADVETEDIVLLENTQEAVSPITAGEITVFFNVEHTGIGGNDISTQIYKSGVAYGSPVVDSLSQGETADILHIVPVIEAFGITDNVSFRVTATKTGTILGSVKPSVLKIKRENI